MAVTEPIKVMLVDDSAVVRKLLTAALANHPEIKVVGSAANGLIALNKLPLLMPEAVILDVEMPEMDGITTLTRIRASDARLPVIMFSTLTERGASTTFDALAAGASDYVLKPSTQAGETLDHVVAKVLVPKLIALTRSPLGLAMQAVMTSIEGSKPKTGFSETAPSKAPAAPPVRRSVPTGGVFPRADTLTAKLAAAPRPDPLRTGKLQRSSPIVRKPVQVIAIATSTGGPNALAEVIPRLPRALPVPVVIVQHMPPIFTRCLAERLAGRSALTIVESNGEEPLSAGSVYIAPGNRHLEVQQTERGVMTLLSDGPPENSCRPSADVTFRSLARVYQGGVLAVVLTGMGHDGARGAREVAEVGGRIIVQNGPSCVVWGMPRAVEEAGIADMVVPLSEMAGAILSQIGSGLLSPRTSEPER